MELNLCLCHALTAEVYYTVMSTVAVKVAQYHVQHRDQQLTVG